MIREELIKKIQKLLALSSDNGTTEHERNNAYQRAQSLMAQYCIELDDLKVNPEDKIITFEITYKPTGYLKNDNILRYMITEIAQAFGTFYFMKDKEGYYLMGFEANCLITDYVIHALINQGHKDYRDSLKSHPPTAAHKISFWKGFNTGLKTRFIKISDENALILYDKVKAIFKASTTIVHLTKSGSDSNSGYESGKTSAQTAQIHKPLEHTNKGKLLL